MNKKGSRSITNDLIKNSKDKYIICECNYKINKDELELEKQLSDLYPKFKLINEIYRRNKNVFKHDYNIIKIKNKCIISVYSGNRFKFKTKYINFLNKVFHNIHNNEINDDESIAFLYDDFSQKTYNKNFTRSLIENIFLDNDITYYIK